MNNTIIIVRDTDVVEAEIVETAPEKPFAYVVIREGDRINVINLDMPIAREIAKAVETYDHATALDDAEAVMVAHANAQH